MADSAVNRYPLILSGISRGMSGNAILAELRAAGLGIRRQTFFRLVGQARTEVATRDTVVRLSPGQTMPADRVPTWPSVNATGYGHLVSFAQRDLVTGEVTTTRVTVKSSQLLTRVEAEAAAYDVFNANDLYKEGMTLLGYSLIAVNQYVPMVI